MPKRKLGLVAKVTGKPIARSEHEEQSALFKWIDAAMERQRDPKLKLALRWTHAIPNGYYKSIPMRMKAKREGVKSGVLDVLVPSPERGSRNAGYHGLYIEMKRRGGTVSPTQREFMEYLDLVHYKHVVAFCWQTAAMEIVEFLGLPAGTVPEVIEIGGKREGLESPPEWIRESRRKVA